MKNPFIRRKITSYHRQPGFSCLSSDSEIYIVECVYLIFFGIFKYKRSHKVSVPDMHLSDYMRHWGSLIAKGERE